MEVVEEEVEVFGSLKSASAGLCTQAALHIELTTK